MANYKKEKINDYISCKHILDSYILDDYNAILVIKDEDTGYNMLHVRLVNEKIEVINRWHLNNYHFGFIHDITIIKSLNIFQVQNVEGNFNALYNYREGKFIVPIGIWNAIDAGRRNCILNKYNGFLAYFTVESDYEDDDKYSYVNEVTGDRIFESFTINDGTYFALINVDGTIRGNKLFKGATFSKITEIIDLEKYDSIDEFKKERIQACNSQKQDNKQKYHELLESRNDGSISPYFDSEVAKVLSLK